MEPHWRRLQSQAPTTEVQDDVKPSVRALVHVDSLHTKQTKPNLFLCRSTTLIEYMWMNLSSMYNQTVQPTEMGFFSLSLSLKETSVKVCLRGPRWRNVQRPPVSGGLAVPSGGGTTQRGHFPWIETREYKELKNKHMAQAFGPTHSCQALWPIQERIKSPNF